MTQKLAGKVALVTGASKSIGQRLAVGLGAAGARLAVNSKTDAAGAQTTCERIRQAGGEAEAFQADIGSKVEFERLVDRVCERFGRLDVLVNNAARTRFGYVFDITEEDFDDVVNTNLRGPFFGSAAAARRMIAQGGGSIINISSCAAKVIIRMSHSILYLDEVILANQYDKSQTQSGRIRARLFRALPRRQPGGSAGLSAVGFHCL